MRYNRIITIYYFVHSHKKYRNEETRVQGGKGEKRRYAEDKPDCAYCYFRKKKGACRLKKCYYLLPEKPEKGEETCEDCPYGKHSPCIGYCLLKIVREMKMKV